MAVSGFVVKLTSKSDDQWTFYGSTCTSLAKYLDRHNEGFVPTTADYQGSIEIAECLPVTCNVNGHRLVRFIRKNQHMSLKDALPLSKQLTLTDYEIKLLQKG